MIIKTKKLNQISLSSLKSHNMKVIMKGTAQRLFLTHHHNQHER